MKAIAKKPRLVIPAGLHAAYISEVKTVLTTKGELFVNPEGIPAVDIVFRDKENRSIKLRYWKAPQYRWVLERILIAIGKNPKAEIAGRDLLKQWVWLIVANEYQYENGIAKLDMDEQPVFYPVVVPEFITYKPEEEKPYFFDDPALNNGHCSGMFKRENNIINTYSAQGVKIGNIPDHSQTFK